MIRFTTNRNFAVIPCALQRVLRDALPLRPEEPRSADSKDEAAGLLRMKTLRRRHGIQDKEVDPGSATRHSMPRRIRDDLRRWAGAVLATFALAACSNASEPASRTYDRDPSLGELPFSSAVVVGDTIYLSGEIGRAPGTTTVVEGGVGAETRQVFENYKATLARLGSGLDDIVKCTVFLEDMSAYAEMNAAYAEAFPGEKPARSTVGVDGLALGAALEIECLAVKGGGS